jgi:PIN domain nuclease of toxin-antitoxin system
LSYLLDTNALLWWLEKSPRLSSRAAEVIANRESVIYVSPVSIWEVAIKMAVGKLKMEADLLALVRMNGFIELVVSHEHAFRVRNLPLIHRDPFDRLLIAQALTERLAVVTSDDVFERYGVQVVRM